MINLMRGRPEVSGVAIFTIISCRDMAVRFANCNGAMARGAGVASRAVIHARRNRKSFS